MVQKQKSRLLLRVRVCFVSTFVLERGEGKYIWICVVDCHYSVTFQLLGARFYEALGRMWGAVQVLVVLWAVWFGWV